MTAAAPPTADQTLPTPPYPRHPLSELFGTYVGTPEFDELRRSIRYGGQLRPIILLDYKVLDGWHRYLACLAEGVEPRVEDYAGETRPSAIIHYLAGEHVARRQMSPSQRAMAAARLVSAHPENTQLVAGKMFSVGETVILEAGRVLRHGVPELAAMVERGVASIKAAAVVAVSLTAAEQSKLVAKGPMALKGRAVEIRRAARKAKVKPAGEGPIHHRRQPSRTNPTLNATLNAISGVRESLPRLLDTPEGQRFRKYVATLGLPWLKDADVGITTFHQVFLLLTAAAQPKELSLDELKRLLQP